GRNAVLEEMSAMLEIGVESITSNVIATRGNRLALSRTQTWGRDKRPEAFHTDVFDILELNADAEVAARVVFDLDDLDAAFAELDARYLAGEAAAHAHTWAVITSGHAVVNRGELPPMSPDCVSTDHRRGATFAPGDLIGYFRAGWELGQNIRTYVESVHRLSDLGAVCTHVGHGVSREGFDAEWRGIDLLTVDGDMVSRCEVFDEADLDSAIARFEQLSRPASRLENAASQVVERFLAHFAPRDWGAILAMMADHYLVDDRRRAVNAGIRHGRGAATEDFRAAADVGFTDATSTVIATRGTHLALTLARFSNQDQRPESFQIETLLVAEIDAYERLAEAVVFELDDFNAAMAELDARYLAGEAAAQAETWSVIRASYAAINRHEQPPTTPDWVNVDHRREIAMGPSDLMAYMSAGLDADQDVTSYVATVHRLNSGGAVITYAAQETSRDGFDAEWRGVAVLAVDGEMVSRIELFDEADIDIALAKFEELDRPAPPLENDAIRAWAPVVDAFNRRDMEGLLAHGNANGRFEDRRKGLRDVVDGLGRRKVVHTMFETVPSGWRLEVEPVAVRGSRLALTRGRYRDVDDADQPIAVELLHVTELGDDGLMHDTVNFDPDDMNAAFAELDARYSAGEAAAHPHTWSAIAEAYAAINRGQLPSTTTDFVDIDHRRGAAMAPGEMIEFLRSALDQTPNLTIRIAAVHRL
ncbi:MAG: BTAD domain-containing putative transcriptional regulator, partial [Ilumatobacteraceae bacterium]